MAADGKCNHGDVHCISYVLWTYMGLCTMGLQCRAVFIRLENKRCWSRNSNELARRFRGDSVHQILLFYPETSNRTLEDMDHMFIQNPSVFVLGKPEMTQCRRPASFATAEAERIARG
ncbi:hypothetical protein Daesc_004549 [Daldinia eschscholtzii]|uniref:Uncharacterized protein n=1 Tax=Daldinia eschscholtzii TaxID=292717 RepID=A0AAX6MQY3_9PEZI